jgi:hypothetical protein
VRKFLLPLAAIFTLALAGSAMAAAGKMRTDPGVFDPGKLGTVSAAWVPGAGLADAGASNHGLVLTKGGLITDNTAAGASIIGLAGESLVTPLAFDYKNGSLCTGGAPRFNLQTDVAFHFLGGCGNGTQTPGPAGWTHVTINPQDPAQAFPVVSPTEKIVSLSLIVDEPGTATLDNITVNGRTNGKPGNSQ